MILDSRYMENLTDAFMYTKTVSEKNPIMTKNSCKILSKISLLEYHAMCFARLFPRKTAQLFEELISFTCQRLHRRTRKRGILRASKKLRLGVSKRIPPHRFRSFGSSAHRRGFFVPNNLPPPHGGGYCLHYDQVNSFNTRRPAKTTSKDRVETDAARHDLCNFMYLQRVAR